MNSQSLEEAWRAKSAPAHAALVRGTQAQYRKAMEGFFSYCANSHRRCLLAQETLSLPAWTSRFPSPPSLQTWSWKSFPRKSHAWIKQAWEEELSKALQQARAEGLTGVCVILDARHAPRRLADWLEKALEEFIRRHAASALCLYRLPPESTGKKLLPFFRHPFIMLKGELCENIFCPDAPKSIAPAVPGLTLRQALRQLSGLKDLPPISAGRGEPAALDGLSQSALALERCGLGAKIISPDLVIEYQSALLAEQFPEAVGRHCYSVYLRADSPCPDCPALLAISTGKPHQTRKSSANGRVYEIISAPFRDADGTIKAVQTLREITQSVRAEERLRESEAKYRAFYERASESFLLLSLEGIILDANPAVSRLSGYSREELLGQSVGKLLPDFFRKQLPEGLKRVQREGRRQGRYECVCKDGSRISIEGEASLAQIAGQERILAISWDVTQSSWAERKLRESEECYRSLFENAPEAISYSKGGLIQDANPVFARLFGFNHPRELIGKSELELVAPEDRDRIRAYTEQRLAGKKVPRQYEFKGRHQSGAVLDLSISVSEFILRGELYTQAIVRDISEGKHLESELRRSEEQLRHLTAAAPAVICRLTSEGQTLFVNEHVFQVTGYRPEELVGRNWWQVFYPGELREQVENLYREFASGNVSDYEMTLLTKNGGHRTIAWNSGNLFGSDGTVREIVGVGLDVTARRRMEEERAKWQEQFLQSQKMEAIKLLAGGIAHDFNNLLGTLLGQSTLLKMKLRSSDPLFRPVELMEQVCRQTLDLTHELQSLARPVSALSEPLDLNRVARRVAESIRRTLDPEVSLESRFQEKCWAVMGDFGQLEHALLDLCLFAREAMSSGGRLTLRTQNLILDESTRPGRIALRPGPYVLVTVGYTGPTLSPEDLNHIFDPFWTPRNSTQGSGLMLALAYSVIQAHHGQIQAESQPEQENRFLIYFPAFPEKRIPVKAPAEGEGWESLAKGKETILVVDDDPLVRELLAKELTTLGYQPLVAESGEEAMAILEKAHPEVDLVILDWVMPGWGGKGTFQRLHQQYPSLKILISSGYGLDQSIQETLRAGAAGFLPKPYLLPELAQTLRHLLNKKKSAPSETTDTPED